MAFTHINTIRTSYSAGGVVIANDVSKTETAGAEINISEAIATDAVTETTDIDFDYFVFELANRARSVFIKLDGFNGALYAENSSAVQTKMLDLDNGEPYSWSYNGASDFPVGNTNPMVNDTVKLIVRPDAGAGVATAGTLTVKVLYDPTA